MAVAVLCAHQLVRTVKYKAAADPTDLQQALKVVEHVKKLPDAEFINQLSKICFDNYGQFPSDPQDRICVICLAGAPGETVQDPVRAPRCRGNHFSCKSCYVQMLARYGDKCPVCRQ